MRYKIHSLLIALFFSIFIIPVYSLDGDDKSDFPALTIKQEIEVEANINTKKSEMADIKPSSTSILDLPDSFLQQVIAYFPLKEAIRAEEVCRKWHEDLANSKQYKALIHIGNRLNLNFIGSARDIFFQMKRDSRYQIELLNAWRNYFFLQLKDETLPLSFYWEDYINLNNSIVGQKLNRLYKECMSDPSVKEDRYYLLSAKLGEILTRPKITNFSTLADYTKSQGYTVECLRDIAYFLKIKDCPPQLLDEVKVHGTFLLGIPKNGDVALKIRTALLEVINNPTAESHIKAAAHLHMGEMDYFGSGLPQRDHVSARNYFQKVLNNPAATPPIKFAAHYKIGTLDLHGFGGIPQADFKNATYHFDQILNNPAANPEDKAKCRQRKLTGGE